MTVGRVHKASLTLALATSLCAFAGSAAAQTSTAKRPASKAGAQQNVPEEYRLESSSCEWRISGESRRQGGGYRVKGIASVDQAFKALGGAQVYAG